MPNKKSQYRLKPGWKKEIFKDQKVGRNIAGIISVHADNVARKTNRVQGQAAFTKTFQLVSISVGLDAVGIGHRKEELETRKRLTKIILGTSSTEIASKVKEILGRERALRFIQATRITGDVLTHAFTQLKRESEERRRRESEHN